MVVRIEHRVKCQLRQLRRDTKDKGMYRRCQIVLLAARDRPRQQIAESVGCSVSWVWRVVKRFVKDGVAGLVDHREDNGALKLDEHFLAELHDAVDRCPRDYGYPRPTWTQELLCRVMAEKTGVRVHPGTMSRGLAILRARLGWPKPTVNCPWPKRRRNRRLLEIRRLIDSLGGDEMAFYLDEVDIHLNPKIGRDWMNRGQQKVVVTPGQNVKRYLAGAQDAVTGELIWVRGERKNSLLVIALLRELVRRHPTTKRIHVVLDNFKIHDSRATRAAVAALGGKVVLHFLPPYCPDHNKIERTWKDLHDNVTRNHRCATMDELMAEVIAYLQRRRRALAQQNRRRAA